MRLDHLAVRRDFLEPLYERLMSTELTSGRIGYLNGRIRSDGPLSPDTYIGAIYKAHVKDIVEKMAMEAGVVSVVVKEGNVTTHAGNSVEYSVQPFGGVVVREPNGDWHRLFDAMYRHTSTGKAIFLHARNGRSKGDIRDKMYLANRISREPAVAVRVRPAKQSERIGVSYVVEGGSGIVKILENRHDSLRELGGRLAREPELIGEIFQSPSA